ncbi:MAG: glycoside hydrolase family 15 protein [Thermoplasmata archaeon]
MVRYLPIGNGRLLVNFDYDYRIADFYYSKDLSENHSIGKPFRFGICVNGKFSWIERNLVEIGDYLDHTMVGYVKGKFNDVEFETKNFVDIYSDIYVRKVTLNNLSNEKKNISLFFHQNFYIYGNNIGDTAGYFPEIQGIVHYKGRRYFYISSIDENGRIFDQFSTGIKDFEGLEGTWRDAEDCNLSMNPIATGSVDSVIRHSINLEGNEKINLYYYILCAENLDSIEKDQDKIDYRYLERLESRTSNYWKVWHEKEFVKLEPDYLSFFKRSLFIIRSHVNDIGGIVASSDSDILKSTRDEYYYVWPRDASIAAYSLIFAGHTATARKFFEFARDVISPRGYFYHKYRMDGNLASSWIPHIYKNNEIIPIQEDETSLVLWAIHKYFKKSSNVEFISKLYDSVIIKASKFILDFREDNGLPKPSFDVWEERYGIHAYTVSTTYAALKASSEMAREFGDSDYATEFEKAAEEMKNAFEKYFYSDSRGYYARAIIDGNADLTIDSAVMSAFIFGMKDPRDKKIESSMNHIMEKLWVKGIGGLARYENDNYQRIKKDDNIIGNPWNITTLWAAQYYILNNNISKASELIDWVYKHAQHSGILSEQLNPYDGSPLSVSPLIWSHAEMIITLIMYDELLKKNRNSQHF